MVQNICGRGRLWLSVVCSLVLGIVFENFHHDYFQSKVLKTRDIEITNKNSS